jgi:hypothetical protein
MNIQKEGIKIDFEKYGFVLRNESEDKFMAFYEFKLDKHTLVELAITFNNTVTIDVDHYDDKGEWSSKLTVANRYQVETQDQFDFLILNGRVGWVFKGGGVENK